MVGSDEFPFEFRLHVGFWECICNTIPKIARLKFGTYGLQLAERYVKQMVCSGVCLFFWHHPKSH